MRLIRKNANFCRSRTGTLRYLKNKMTPRLVPDLTTQHLRPDSSVRRWKSCTMKISFLRGRGKNMPSLRTDNTNKRRHRPQQNCEGCVLRVPLSFAVSNKIGRTGISMALVSNQISCHECCCIRIEQGNPVVCFYY